MLWLEKERQERKQRNQQKHSRALSRTESHAIQQLLVPTECDSCRQSWQGAQAPWAPVVMVSTDCVILKWNSLLSASFAQARIKKRHEVTPNKSYVSVSQGLCVAVHKTGNSTQTVHVDTDWNLAVKDTCDSPPHHPPQPSQSLTAPIKIHVHLWR